jgi:CcmD family protein
MENFGYLFAAYSIIFAALFLYVLFIGRRQARLEAEIRALEQRLKSLGSGPEPVPAQDSASSRS